jgi:V/A-type H+-transporting ATPase subunit F
MSRGGELKLAVVGDYESALPFQSVGVEPHYIEAGQDENLTGLLSNLSRSGYAVIFLVENLYGAYQSLVAELNEQYAVAIIPIPGLKGSQGIGVESIKNSVERAVGMDIFSVQ